MNTRKAMMVGAVAAAGLTVALTYAAPQWRGDMMGMMGGPGMMSGPGMMGNPGMMHGQGGMAAGQMAGHGMGAPQIVARLQELEQQLQLTAAQQEHWQAFKQVVERQAASMVKHHQQMASAFSQSKSMTLPERVALQKQMMGERFASMTLFTNALTDLYQQLDPAQQKLMDQHPVMGGM